MAENSLLSEETVKVMQEHMAEPEKLLKYFSKKYPELIAQFEKGTMNQEVFSNLVAIAISSDSMVQAVDRLYNQSNIKFTVSGSISFENNLNNVLDDIKTRFSNHPHLPALFLTKLGEIDKLPEKFIFEASYAILPSQEIIGRSTTLNKNQTKSYDEVYNSLLSEYIKKDMKTEFSATKNLDESFNVDLFIEGLVGNIMQQKFSDNHIVSDKSEQFKKYLNNYEDLKFDGKKVKPENALKKFEELLAAASNVDTLKSSLLKKLKH